MTKRILHIIASLDRGGAEKQLVMLATRLPRTEFDVHVCALARGGPLEPDLARAGIPVSIIGKRLRVDPVAYARLDRHVRRLRPDLVHTWISPANTYGRLAALRCGVPRIVASHRCAADPTRSIWRSALDRFLAARSDAIVVNSPAVRDHCASRGIAREKLHVIPSGVEPFQATAETRAALLAELGLPPNARLVGGVGPLVPQKRWKDVIWAADLLKVFRDDVHLLILGDGPHRYRLERYRDLVRIADKVHFLGERDDVPRFLSHFDVLWLGSEAEGLPNAILEAMAAGVPVVASDVPGNRGLVEQGQTGYLVPLGDRAALARYANKLIDDAPLAKRFGQQARERVLSRYRVDDMVARYSELYRKLLAE